MATLHKMLGPFELQERLGGGAQGEVYRAWHAATRRMVAVKVLRPEFAGDPTFRERFQLEATTCANLEHPSIVPVHDFGEADGAFYMAMRFVDGESLAERMRRQPLSPQDLVAVVRDIGAALDHAHQRGVVHRDMKPANVLCDESGNFLLVDFGVAKILSGGTELTLQGHTVGTAAYMSPEQCQGHALDGASDRYSLGVVAYEALLGERPFQGPDALSVQRKHIHMAPSFPDECIQGVSPSVSAALVAWLQRALAKDPAERFPSGAAMVAALGAALAGAAGVPAPREADGPEPAVMGATAAPRTRGLSWWSSAVGGGVLLGFAALQAVPAPRMAAASASGVASPSQAPAQPTAGRGAVPTNASAAQAGRDAPLAITAAPVMPAVDQAAVLLAAELQQDAALAAAVEANLVAALRRTCSSTTAIQLRPNRQQVIEVAGFDLTQVLRHANEDFIVLIEGKAGATEVRPEVRRLRTKPSYDGGGRTDVKVDLQFTVRVVCHSTRDVLATVPIAVPGVFAPTLAEAHDAACAAAAQAFARRVAEPLQSGHLMLRREGPRHDLVLVTTPGKHAVRTQLGELLRQLPPPGAVGLELVEADAIDRFEDRLVVDACKRIDTPRGSQLVLWRFRYPATREWLERELGAAMAASPLLGGHHPEVYAEPDVLAWIVR